jgi:hypothetical protein
MYDMKIARQFLSVDSHDSGGYGKSGCHPFFGQNLTFWRKIAFGDTWLACGKVGRKDAVAR